MQGRKRSQAGVVWLLLAAILVWVTACSKEEPKKPSRWEGGQEKTAGQPATVKQALAGSAFNKFFPPASDGFKLTYTQEKEGFVEAKLEDANGKEVATLAVFDTISNPSAAEKFQSSAEKLQNYPMVAVGDNGTALLLANRLQVQVRSKEASFDANARQAWLQKFDLKGLAGLVTP